VSSLAATPLAVPDLRLVTPSSWVYYAQRAVSGAWLDRAGLPLENVAMTWDLTADTFTADIAPAIALAPAADGRPLLDEWSTLIYAVADGQIRWGGIHTHSDLAGPTWSVTATGFRGYPPGQPYTGPDTQRTGMDPLDGIRLLWAHLQSFPSGNLHLTVDAATHSSARLGTPAVAAHGSVAAVAAQPWEMAPWNLTDVGQEITRLAGTIPADMTESHAWAPGSTEQVNHTLSFAVPRAGTRRADLRFVEDENMAAVVPLTRDGSAYANGIAGAGAGSGSTTIAGQVAVDDGRLRRFGVYQDQGVTTIGALKPLLSRELAARQNMGGAASVTIANHPNAPLGSVSVGDDILLQFTSGWLGGQQIWHRVTAITLNPATGIQTLTTARSDSFSYAPTYY
jgi:hypothetical protein